MKVERIFKGEAGCCSHGPQLWELNPWLPIGLSLCRPMDVTGRIYPRILRLWLYTFFGTYAWDFEV